MTDDLPVFPERLSLLERLKAWWVNPQPLNIDETRHFDFGSSPRCPQCPHEEGGMLHVDLGDLVVWPDQDAYDSPAGTRGEFILVPLDCEHCGTRSALAIGNHKGRLYLTMLQAAPGRGAPLTMFRMPTPWLTADPEDRG